MCFTDDSHFRLCTWTLQRNHRLVRTEHETPRPPCSCAECMCACEELYKAKENEFGFADKISRSELENECVKLAGLELEQERTYHRRTLVVVQARRCTQLLGPRIRLKGNYDSAC